MITYLVAAITVFFILASLFVLIMIAVSSEDSARKLWKSVFHVVVIGAVLPVFPDLISGSIVEAENKIKEGRIIADNAFKEQAQLNHLVSALMDETLVNRIEISHLYSQLAATSDLRAKWNNLHSEYVSRYEVYEEELEKRIALRGIFVDRHSSTGFAISSLNVEEIATLCNVDHTAAEHLKNGSLYKRDSIKMIEKENEYRIRVLQEYLKQHSLSHWRDNFDILTPVNKE